jgi:uncharacterized damage-inducible protein DinB
MTNDLRYPIGKFKWSGSFTPEEREKCIQTIAEAPDKLAEALKGLTEEQLDTPYREGGWTVRQVAHHLADAHMNTLMRFKLALTESDPAIKTYDEDGWASLADSRQAPVEMALDMYRSIHAKWVYLMRNMTESDFAKTFHYPENRRTLTLDQTLGIYAWHSLHHVAHITSLRERMGW